MTLPHELKRITLSLARSRELPVGSSRLAYEFVAPLDGQGRIDAALWRKHREHCRVHRFCDGEDDQTGFLIHVPGGSEHAQWVFHYGAQHLDDETGYRFGVHAFVPGEYVSIRDHNGELHTFHITSVQAAT